MFVNVYIDVYTYTQPNIAHSSFFFLCKKINYLEKQREETEKDKGRCLVSADLFPGCPL